MKRSEFIKLWSDVVAEGRKKNHPGIRVSEAACNRMEDDKKAARMWAKHRAAFAPCTVEHVRFILTGK
jgi:hypothetical protein